MVPMESLRPSAMVGGCAQLPKPCGIFTCTDGWARTVVRYARVAGLRVPEDIALVGADNDALECELMAPPLSSVMIPWQEVGRSAAKLVQLALSGESIDRQAHGDFSAGRSWRADLRTFWRSMTRWSPRPCAGFARTRSALDRARWWLAP